VNRNLARRVARLELDLGLVRGSPQQRRELAVLEAEVDAIVAKEDELESDDLVQAAFTLQRLHTRLKPLREAMKSPAERRAETEAAQELDRQFAAMSSDELKAWLANYQPEEVSERAAREHEIVHRAIDAMSGRDLDKFHELMCE